MPLVHCNGIAGLYDINTIIYEMYSGAYLVVGFIQQREKETVISPVIGQKSSVYVDYISIVCPENMRLEDRSSDNHSDIGRREFQEFNHRFVVYIIDLDPDGGIAGVRGDFNSIEILLAVGRQSKQHASHGVKTAPEICPFPAFS